MKKVILAVLLTAFALFLILPSLSWAQEDLYKAKCAGCHGADGKGTAAGKKMGAPEFSSPAVQKMSNADLVDYIENGGPQKKAIARLRQQGRQPGRCCQAGYLREEPEVGFTSRWLPLRAGST